MKYWGYLAGKLTAIFLVFCSLNFAALRFFPPPPLTRFGRERSPFLHDMAYTFAVWGIWLIAAGLFSIAIRDQRRRCRTCLRLLIMPVNTGSWGNILTLGRPRIEWICPYGHGTLRINELQITGKESPDWEAHGDDIWKELESYESRK